MKVFWKLLDRVCDNCKFVLKVLLLRKPNDAMAVALLMGSEYIKAAIWLIFNLVFVSSVKVFLVNLAMSS